MDAEEEIKIASDGNQTSVVQPVAVQYTDWDILTPYTCSKLQYARVQLTKIQRNISPVAVAFSESIDLVEFMTKLQSLSNYTLNNSWEHGDPPLQ
jgi:hypothetical protein